MGKNIVICCDGTGNEYGDRNTNVVKLFGIIEKHPEKQIAYYDPGVGTFSTPGAWTRFAKWFTKLMGLAFATGINTNIEDAYRYLMDKYEEGDRVFLFGFSRGAFTVRALAGMLHKVGLLEKGSYNLIPYAMRMYRAGESKIAAGFKATFSRECKTYFVGVWDTVKSVGLIIPRKFPNAKLNEDVSFGYHAIAIDEKRSKFRPNLWEPPTTPEQKIEQVWFAGVHSDVGGSYLEDGLSNIALKWMIDKARDRGVKINETAYYEITTDHTDKLHNSLWPYWWVLGWWRRKIERGAWIHESVYKRIDDVKDYNPKNLPSKDQLKVVD